MVYSTLYIVGGGNGIQYIIYSRGGAMVYSTLYIVWGGNGIQYIIYSMGGQWYTVHYIHLQKMNKK